MFAYSAVLPSPLSRLTRWAFGDASLISSLQTPLTFSPSDGSADPSACLHVRKAGCDDSLSRVSAWASKGKTRVCVFTEPIAYL